MNELEFCERLVPRLVALGDAKLIYITAEMQPFSNQFRPDILLVPRIGPRKNQSIFLEVKAKALQTTSTAFADRLIGNKRFAEESLDVQIFKYVFLNDASMDELTARKLRDERVIVLPYSVDFEATVSNIEAIVRE